MALKTQQQWRDQLKKDVLKVKQLKFCADTKCTSCGAMVDVTEIGMCCEVDVRWPSTFTPAEVIRYFPLTDRETRQNSAKLNFETSLSALGYSGERLVSDKLSGFAMYGSVYAQLLKMGIFI